MRPKLQLQVLNSVKTSSNEGGFAIPIAIRMGLILIVMATTAIVRSQGDRVASINIALRILFRTHRLIKPSPQKEAILQTS
jgi:hypothetical protein